MSVIVQNTKSKQVINFIKGADMAIQPLIQASKNDGLSAYTLNVLNDFASRGLRTLCFGMKEIDGTNTKESLKDIEDEQLENNIELLGGTGLEDLLQDDVKQCITDFRDARIKVWMLTGDKAETAFSIGISCGLINTSKHTICKIKEVKFEAIQSEMQKITKSLEYKTSFKKTYNNHAPFKKEGTASTRSLTQDYEMVSLNTPNRVHQITEEGITQHSEGEETKNHFVLMLDGASLAVIFGNESLLKILNEIFEQMDSIIVYRCSPHGKAQIVTSVKNSSDGLCLAIGDGANDINMIHQAHIGVGI